MNTKKNCSKAPIEFCYHFIFDTGEEKIFPIPLDPITLDLLEPLEQSEPYWTKLTHCQCKECLLEEDKNEFCPTALSIVNIVKGFSNYESHERVDVIVKTRDRTYIKTTTIQQGLSSLLGIYMVTSGCPTLSKLRPMVRFHLPFATLDETIFRSAGAYLLGQYFLNKKGKGFDITLNGLLTLYRKIQLINNGMARRLRSISEHDSNINALILLDIFAKDIPSLIEDRLEEIEHFFTVYYE